MNTYDPAIIGSCNEKHFFILVEFENYVIIIADPNGVFEQSLSGLCLLFSVFFFSEKELKIT